ncbi:glycerate kinase [Actinotignum timonense]|nr:glycerate kinase [Actinotignum timonense]MDY5138412.1 glycerate kinase [Actinotignum timonense]
MTIRVACDVDNPLLGERGASAIYGPPSWIL